MTGEILAVTEHLVLRRMTKAYRSTASRSDSPPSRGSTITGSLPGQHACCAEGIVEAHPGSAGGSPDPPTALWRPSSVWTQPGKKGTLRCTTLKWNQGGKASGRCPGIGVRKRF